MTIPFQEIAAFICVALAAGVAIRRVYQTTFPASNSSCGGCGSCPAAKASPQIIALQPLLQPPNRTGSRPRAL